jgi:hypothetical protein
MSTLTAKRAHWLARLQLWRAPPKNPAFMAAAVEKRVSEAKYEKD